MVKAGIDVKAKSNVVKESMDVHGQACIVLLWLVYRSDQFSGLWRSRQG